MTTVTPTNSPEFKVGDYVRVVLPGGENTSKIYSRGAAQWVGCVFQLTEKKPFYWQTSSKEPTTAINLGFYPQQLIPFEWKVGDIARVINQDTNVFGKVTGAVGKCFEVTQIGHKTYKDDCVKLKCLEQVDNVFGVGKSIFVEKKYIIPVVYGQSVPLNTTVTQQSNVPKMRYINGD